MNLGMVRYTCWNKYQASVSVYQYNEAEDVWFFDARAEVPPEIRTLIKVKQRLANVGGTITVYTQDGQIIDEPA
jgi:hypothetical protein